MMNDRDPSEADSPNEPLFVLKYRAFMRAGIVFIFSFWIFFFGVCTFVVPANGTIQLLYKPFFGFVSFILLFLVVELVLFREIRLYRDKIVKEWRLIGSKEIELANARLENCSRCGASTKLFSDQDSNSPNWLRLLFPTRVISYAEHFADPEDVKELNRLLADLSGRKVEEFEETARLKTLIKEQDEAFQSHGPSRWETYPIIVAANRTLTKILRPVRDTDQPVASYVWRAWLIAFLPSLAISAIVTLTTSLPGPKGPTPGHAWFWVVAVLVLSPWLETLAMWPILRILKEVSKKTLGIALVSALIWGFIHSRFALGWGLTIFWPFFVFSVCFLEWEKKSTTKAIIVTALVHMCQNMMPASIELLAALAGARS